MSESTTLIDGTLLIFIVSWSLMKVKFSRNIENQLKQVHNKHTLFLVLLLYILQMYFYIILISLFAILLLQLFKLVILEQFAKLANGYYFFSVEKLSRKLMYFFTSKPHLIFNITMLVIIILYTYLNTMFMLGDETDPKTKKIQLIFMLDMIITIYAIAYLVWLCSSIIMLGIIPSTADKIILGLIFGGLLLILIRRFISVSKDKVNNKNPNDEDT
jgi:hypothetical protein